MKLRQFVAALLFSMLGWSATASAQDMLVSAATSLTEAFAELAVQFQQAHPGTKVLMSFAGSDTLMQHIVDGMPSDVYAAADRNAMDKAVAARAMDVASRKDFAGNEVVLIVPADNPARITSLDDLAAAGAWNNVKQREVLGQNVRQVLDQVARGGVDAGFVFATDAATMPDKVKVIQKLSPAAPVVYSIALVERANRHPLAADFIAFVLSDQGQSILAKYKFTKP